MIANMKVFAGAWPVKAFSYGSATPPSPSHSATSEIFGAVALMAINLISIQAMYEMNQSLEK